MLKTNVKPQEDTLLTIREVAKQLRVDATTVRRWITLGALDAVRLPGSPDKANYRIKSSEMMKLLGGK